MATLPNDLPFIDKNLVTQDDEPSTPSTSELQFVVMYPAQEGETPIKALLAPPGIVSEEAIYSLAQQNVPFNLPFVISTTSHLDLGFNPDFCDPDGYGLGGDRFDFEVYRNSALQAVDPEEQQFFTELALAAAQKVLNSVGDGAD